MRLGTIFEIFGMCFCVFCLIYVSRNNALTIEWLTALTGMIFGLVVINYGLIRNLERGRE